MKQEENKGKKSTSHIIEDIQALFEKEGKVMKKDLIKDFLSKLTKTIYNNVEEGYTVQLTNIGIFYKKTEYDKKVRCPHNDKVEVKPIHHKTKFIMSENLKNM